jgi:hypothetical protein
MFNTTWSCVSGCDMSVLGMPTAMFLVFVATLLAGSLGAIHYVAVHVIMGKPFDETIRDNSTGMSD